MSFPASAESIYLDEDETITFSKNLEESVLFDQVMFVDEYFSKDEIIAFADYHKDVYLNGKIDGKDVTVGDDIVPLYYTDNKLASWFVPYLSSNGNVEGYIIMGSNMDSYNFYGLVEDSEGYHDAKRLYDSGKELILVLPADFIYKEGDAYYNRVGEKIFTNNLKAKSMQVTESTTDAQAIIEKSYQAVSTDKEISKNRSENIAMLNIIKNRDADAVKERSGTDLKLQAAPRAATIDARLKEENSVPATFLSIWDGGTRCYGGDQGWYTKGSLMSEEGCGVIAAANITAYMAKHKGKSRLYTAGSTTYITKKDFMNHIYSVSQYVSPRKGLLPGVLFTNFKEGVKYYSTMMLNPLKEDTSISNLHDFWSASAYIIQALRDNRPVAICVYAPNGLLDSKYYWHWMTVTKYYQDAADNRWVALSTWGERHSLNWRLLHNYQGAAGVGSGVYNRIVSFK